MTGSPVGGILDWSSKVDEVGSAGTSAERTASPAELAQIAADLGVVSLEALTAKVVLKACGGGKYRLTGHIEGRVTQSCVVSLEPVPARILEDFQVEFWPPELIGPPADGEQGVLEADIPEPIEHGRIAIGRLVFEHVAACLDPYPRAPEATFDAAAHGVGADKVANPFAVLAKLKPKP